MIRQRLKVRAYAFAALGLLALGLAGFVRAAGDGIAVARASDAADADTLNSVTSPSLPAPMSAPAVQLAAGEPRIVIGEYLNTELGGLGLTIDELEFGPLRPLGGGLRLAEINIRAGWSPQDAANFSGWVAVNREAVRLGELTISLDPDGGQTSQARLYVVVT